MRSEGAPLSLDDCQRSDLVAGIVASFPLELRENLFYDAVLFKPLRLTTAHQLSIYLPQRFNENAFL